MTTSTNPVVQNAIAAKACNAKFKVGDKVTIKRDPHRPTKILRVLEMPKDERIIASEFGSDWEDVRDDFLRQKTWYNLELEGKGAFYSDMDLKKADPEKYLVGKLVSQGGRWAFYDVARGKAYGPFASEDEARRAAAGMGWKLVK